MTGWCLRSRPAEPSVSLGSLRRRRPLARVELGMARLARSFVRLVVVLVLAGALVAAAVGSIAYSTGRLFHDVATAKETRYT